MPTTAEVEKDGIDLGNNQALLLKKVEELTLFMIDQNKKIEAQRKEMQKQQKEMEKQQQQIKKLTEHLSAK